MRIFREAYTKEEIISRISDTKNIMNALSDSLSILQSALYDIGEEKLSRYVRSYSIDLEDMITNFDDDFETFMSDDEEPEEEDELDIEDELNVEESLEHKPWVAHYKGFTVKMNNDDEYYGIFDKDNELIKHGFQTLADAKDAIDSNEDNQYNECMLNEGSKGSVEDYFSKMKGKSKPEAQKIVMKAKGNPNAEEAYKKYLKSFKEIEEGLEDTLRTVEFGEIKIVPNDKITKFDKFIKNDLVNEWSYYQTADGDIVATKNESLNKTLEEDTIKTKDGKWTNKGDTGETHGKFKTKKEADAQRRAIFANGFKG